MSDDFFADAPLFFPDPEDEEECVWQSAEERASSAIGKRPHAEAFPQQSTSALCSPQHSPHKSPSKLAVVRGEVRLDEDETSAMKHQHPPDLQCGQPATSARTEGENALLSLPWKRVYMGSFVVQAWSTISGQGWLKVGDAVRLVNEVEPPPAAKLPLKKSKQTTLASAFGGQNKSLAQIKKRDSNVLIRFLSPGDVEVGRILKEHSRWLAKMMRNKLVDLEGRVVDCPHKLDMGSDVLLSLDVYLHRHVFLDAGEYVLGNGSDVPSAGLAASNNNETEREYLLSQRKSIFVSLFDELSLRPKNQTETRGMGWMPIGRGVQPEVEADGEEDGPNDGTEINNELVGQLFHSATTELLPGSTQRFAQGDMLPPLPEKEPPASFALELRPYQKQALWWMDAMESPGLGSPAPGTEMVGGEHLHPLWKEYTLPPPPAGEDEESPQQVYFNPYTGDLRVTFPAAGKSARGGILADEMGLGKTVMLASLLHSNPPPTPAEQVDTFGPLADVVEHSVFPRGRATLVVAPLSLLGQWKEELQRASKKGTLRAELYYGSQTEAFPTLLAQQRVDAVITSYGTLASQWRAIQPLLEAMQGATEARKASLAKRVQKVAPLYGVGWHRLVLDEAHTIRNRMTQTSRAASALQAQRRWCLTGTPIVNRLTDLFQLLAFLRVEPWGNWAFFNALVAKPFQEKNPAALDIVAAILSSTLLRREKRMRDADGNSIVALPNKTYDIQELPLSPVEREIYDNVYAQAKRRYDHLIRHGWGGKVSLIFAVLMRLRQAVCHPALVPFYDSEPLSADEDEANVERKTNALIADLVKRFGQGPDQPDFARRALDDLTRTQRTSSSSRDGGESPTASDAPAQDPPGAQCAFDIEERKAQPPQKRDDISNAMELECQLCLEEVKDKAYLPKCLHSACYDCLVDVIQAEQAAGRNALCPMCRAGPIGVDDLVRVQTDDNIHEESAAPPPQLGPPRESRESTKVATLVRALQDLQATDPSFKAVIFSQFTSFLNIVEAVLHRSGFPTVRIDGTTSQAARAKAVSVFQSELGPTARSPGIRVMLASTRAAGVGLNLTGANHVWLLDCWWNASTEEQAVDRVHRIGQTRPVTVHRILIQDSIEQRIMLIQQRKQALVNNALGKEGADLEENLRLLFSD